MSIPPAGNTFKELGKAPCPVCGHEDRCKANPARDVILCFRCSGDEINGFRRIRQSGDCSTYLLTGSAADRNGRDSRKEQPPKTQPGLDQLAARYMTALTDDLAEKFATALGVSPESLRAVGAGLSNGCLGFPERDATGIVTAINVRQNNGKKQVGRGQKRGLTIPANLQQLPGPVMIVEGATDVCACLTMGLTAVGRPSNAAGSAMLAALLKDREVLVVGENDLKEDGFWPGREGAIKVASALSHVWGRTVRWALPPKDVKDVRVYLQRNHGITPAEMGEKFLSELTGVAETVKSDGGPSSDPRGAYQLTDLGIVHLKTTRHGTVPTPLTNFSARIVSNIASDDGVEKKRVFEIEACLCKPGASSRRFLIPANRFAGLSWVVEELGPGAIVSPGFSTTDHVRAAIQILSDDIVEHYVYLHAGWRQIAGKWVYLHGKGAIGAEGPIGAIQVELPPSLAAMDLPTRSMGPELQIAIRASINLLVVGPHRIAVPLLGAIYRSVLDRADFTISLFGSTGVFKSELAALAQQHFGAGFGARNLPGSFSSTANSLEALAFIAKDILLVIDDFAPSGNAADVARYHAVAERIIRGQGNNSGRGRLRADGELRSAKFPRGLLLITGEEVPRGESLRGRQLIVEVCAGDIVQERLSAAQIAGREGLYAAAMAGFIRWVAGKRESIIQTLRSEAIRFRDGHASALHRRTPEIVANLMAALDLFFKYAVEVGAIDIDEAENLRRLCWVALEEQSGLQAEHVSAVNPATRFIELLRAAIVAGDAHLVGKDGGPPADYENWGWRKHDYTNPGDRPMPQKDCLARIIH